MCAINIDLRDRQVTPDHFHCGMVEHLLKRECISPIAQIGDGKCVAEAMRMAILHTSTFAKSEHETGQAGAIDRKRSACRIVQVTE